MEDIVYTKILRLLRSRDRSEKEVKEFLEKSGVSSADSAFFIERLRNGKLLDDVRFAQNKIRSRMDNKLWGIERIRMELVDFGISSDIISKELSDIEESKWLENCNRLITRSNINIEKQIEIYKLKKKLFQLGYPENLIKMGFTYNNIKEDYEYELG